MLLNYKPKDDHIKIIPLIAVSEAAKKVVITRPQVQLLPGTNEISDDEYLVIKDHIKRELESKVIVPIEKTVPTNKRAPSGKAKNLKEMPTQEAIALVQACVNPETLTKWYQEETREEVRLLITETMKELKMDIPKLEVKGGNENDAIALEDMTHEQLVAYAAEKKISVNASQTKEEILAVIKKAEAK